MPIGQRLPYSFLLLSLLLVPPLQTSLQAQVDAAAPKRAPAATEDVDTDLKRAFDTWQAQWTSFTTAMLDARKKNLVKGGLPPEDVQALQAKAEATRTALLSDFGTRDDLAAGSHLLLARIHEAGRDYAGAVRAYEAAIEAGDKQNPDLKTLHALCLAAMNSKDDVLAAQWMKTTIEVEDRAGQGQRRNQMLRSSYYPRTLIALDDFDGLEALLSTLAREDDKASKKAAMTFGIVLALKRGDVSGAEARVQQLLDDKQTWHDMQASAVLAKLAFDVHAGRFDEGATLVREFLETPVDQERLSAVERNQRRYLAAVAPFLGKAAPALQVDHWVGGKIEGDDVMHALRGKVVVLDFWQPWCEPCRKAMPKLIALQEQHPGQVQVLGLCRIEDYGYDVSAKAAVRPLAPEDYPAHVEDFRIDVGINYPLAIANTPANNQAYRVAGIPTLVIIDRDGIVRYMSCGVGEPGLFELAVDGVLRMK